MRTEDGSCGSEWGVAADILPIFRVLFHTCGLAPWAPGSGTQFRPIGILNDTSGGRSFGTKERRVPRRSQALSKRKKSCCPQPQQQVAPQRNEKPIMRMRSWFGSQALANSRR
jgi:hypothetical protein